MALTCILGFHTWDGCKCSKCGKIRETLHNWSNDCEKCSRCGKTRENAHTWNGCKCTNCGKTRDEGHDWSKDCEKCSICGVARQNAHQWDGIKCSKCGVNRVAKLIANLEDQSSKIRQSAAKELGQSGDRSAVVPLTNALRYPDPFFRLYSAEALGKLGDPRAVEPLIKAMDENHNRYVLSDEICRAAVESLGKIGDSRAVDPLITALGNDWPWLRKSVAVALDDLGEPKWKDLVRGDANDFRRLADSNDPRAIHPLLKAMNGGDIDAAEALGKLGDSRAVETLINALRNDNPEIFLAAVEALGRLRDSRALEPLINAFENKKFERHNYQYRFSIIAALGDIGGSRAVEFLIKLIDKGRYGLLEEIIPALRKLGDSRAIEPLIKCLLADDYLSKDIVLALSELGEPQWGDLVKGDSDDFLRLAEAQDPRATMPLIAALFMYADSEVINAADALGLRGDSRAVEPLIAILGDKKAKVRLAASASLSALGEPKWKEIIKGDADDFPRLAGSGDPRAVEPLVKASDSGEAAASEALSKLGDQRGIDAFVRKLERGSKSERRAAAEILIKLNKQSRINRTQWLTIKEKITSPHVDNHTHSFDCSASTHSDFGLGMRVEDF